MLTQPTGFCISGAAKPSRVWPSLDFVRTGTMTLPDGKRMPFALAELAQSQGYRFPFRGPAEKLADASMYRWLHDAIFVGRAPGRRSPSAS